MKLLPTVLVLAAFLVLLYVSSLRPEEGTPQPVDDPPSYGEANPGAGNVGESGPEASRGDEGAGASGTETESTGGAGGSETADSGKSGAPQQPDPLPVPEPNVAGRGQVTGVVLTPDGSGAAGMRVSLQGSTGEERSAASTDSDGRFTFDDLQEGGSFTVTASDPNFLYTVSTRSVVRLAGDRGAQAKIHMMRGDCTLTGTAMRGSGKPLEMHAIKVSSVGNLEFSVVTDSKGAFRVGGLPAGNWIVQPEGFPQNSATASLPRGSTVHVDLPPVLYPAKLTLEFVDSKIHPYPFSDEDTVTVTSIPTDPDASPDVYEGHLHYHAAAEGEEPAKAHIEFEGLPAGSYVVTAKMLDAPVRLILAEGEDRTRVLTVSAALRGAGLHVPLWAKVGMCIFFLVAAALPFVLFPPPFQATRPANLPKSTPAPPPAEAPSP